MINPIEPEKIYRLMESRVDAQAAIDEVIWVAQRELCIFAKSPAQLAERGFNRAATVAQLRAMLLPVRTHHIRIALHDTAGMESELPRLLALLNQFAAQISIHRTLGIAREARDAMVIADDCHFWRRIHEDHPRSVLTMHSAADTRPYVERFAEIWECSELAVYGGVAGL